MTTSTEKTGWMGVVSRLLTLKTSDQLYRDNATSGRKTRVLSAPRGIRSAFDEKQQQIDRERGDAENFLGEIENHFGTGKKFLSEDYTGTSKLEGSYLSRRFGMKWRHEENGTPLKTEIAFIYSAEHEEGIRIDYLMTQSTRFPSMAVVNDKYHEDGNTHKKLAQHEDVFRSVRRFATHEEFLASPQPPSWFLQQLETYAVNVNTI